MSGEIVLDKLKWLAENLNDWYKGDDPGTKIQTTSYCPVTSSGKLVNRSDNLLIDGGTYIAGVNDADQTDLTGVNKMYGLPDIGAYEVVPTGGSKFLNLGGRFIGLQ